MSRLADFIVVLMGLALAGFLLAGGLGLLVAGLGGFAWKMAPYRRNLNSGDSIAHVAVGGFDRDQHEALAPPKRPVRLFIDFLIAVAVIALGFYRIESPGLLPFLWGG